MPSWEWYFPYHHAPLLGDIAALLVGGAGAAALAAPWPTTTHPLRPYEQLMAVLPPALDHGTTPTPTLGIALTHSLSPNQVLPPASGLSALPPPYADLMRAASAPASAHPLVSSPKPNPKRSP